MSCFCVKVSPSATILPAQPRENVYTNIQSKRGFALFLTLLIFVASTQAVSIICEMIVALDISGHLFLKISTLIFDVFSIVVCLAVAYIVAAFRRESSKKLKELTGEIENEKAAAMAILSEMLPPNVAAKIKAKEPIPPRNYEAVTIFFSDIVGFTNICGAISGNQVVQLLNDTYQTFDSCLENFDVYKVETIGDAYMVSSGVPNKNGDQHAREIASFSLALRERVPLITLPEQPAAKRFEIRIGLHSGRLQRNPGPVVAGVVGVRMPRYCLFGDTVNTASRMESTSEPMRIHVSSATAFYIRKDFELAERGLTPLKRCRQTVNQARPGGYQNQVLGIGKVLTYWLNGYRKKSRLSTYNSM